MKSVRKSQRKKQEKGLKPAPIDDFETRYHARALAASAVELQKEELRSWAVMADWDNAWKTMDGNYGLKQLDVFKTMVSKGLIFRRFKPVHWSVSSKTALAEAELDKAEVVETAAFVRFPMLSIPTVLDEKVPGIRKLSLLIWTTLPWTLPANRAICVNEDLEYTILRHGEHDLIVASNRVDYVEKMCFEGQTPLTISISVMGSDLVGGEYINPIHGLDSEPRPVIHADFVTAGSGTGVVHSAPGFGSDDYKACAPYGIEAFAPVDDMGCFTEEALPRDPWALKKTHAPTGGVDIVLNLMADWVLHRHEHRKQKCFDWRTKGPTFERATAQWFANIEKVKGDALRRLDDVKFVPESGRARLESFVKERSEWCISRQRPWGVPIPALFDKNGKAILNKALINHVAHILPSKTADSWWVDEPDNPDWVPRDFEDGPYTRSKDTMDVWFDSGTSWTQLAEAEQADVYVEGSDQHRGWFQSSLLTHTSASSSSKAPFKMVITHGFTLDENGRKMSKSEGNVIQPRQIMLGTDLPPVTFKARGEINPGEVLFSNPGLGVDALRLWVASSYYKKDVTMGIPVQIAINKALMKYRVTLRLMLGTMHSVRTLPITLLDQMALIQLQNVMKEVSTAYENFEFYKGIHVINRWINMDFSAFYLDALRDRLYCGDGGGVLEEIFHGLLRMLSPVTPMMVEEAWDHRPTWMKDEEWDQMRSQNLQQYPALCSLDDPVIKPERYTVMPDLASSMETVEGEMEWILKAKASVNAALEEGRTAKVITSSLKAVVVITVTGEARSLFKKYAAELTDIFVVSHAKLGEIPGSSDDLKWRFQNRFQTIGGKGTITVLPPQYEDRCERCWKYIETLSNHLCQRCDDVVASKPPPKVPKEGPLDGVGKTREVTRSPTDVSGDRVMN